MLHILNTLSKSRKYWLTLTFSAILIISTTLCIQYFFLLKPCVLCIYQRCALCGIIIAGLIALITPKIIVLRFFSISIWIYSAYKGFCLAKKNIYMVLYPSPFFTCDLFVIFPNWLPLHRWWPYLFNANGNNCLDHRWYFLSFETSQWMFLIFTSYLILASYTMIAQFFNVKK